MSLQYYHIEILYLQDATVCNFSPVQLTSFHRRVLKCSKFLADAGLLCDKAPMLRDTIKCTLSYEDVDSNEMAPDWFMSLFFHS
jgi:hypothetical protein